MTRFLLFLTHSSAATQVTVMLLLFPALTQNPLIPLQTLPRPHLLALIRPFPRRYPLRQHNPGLLARSKQMHIGRTAIRTIERAHPHEPKPQSLLMVMTPDRDAAPRTPRDLLAVSALRLRHDHVRRCGQVGDALGLDHGVERERAARFALAPRAVAAVHDQRVRFEPVPHVFAGAAAFEREGGVWFT